MDPKLLRNMCFAKKHNRQGLMNMKVNNAKAMSALAETVKALVKPKEVKLKIPKGGSCKLNQLAHIAHLKPGKCAFARITQCLRLCQPKFRAKIQTRLQLQFRLWLRLRLQLPKVPRRPQRLQSRGLSPSSSMRLEGLA